MASKEFHCVMYNHLSRQGLSDEGIAEILGIKLSTLAVYVSEWNCKRDAALERQYFLSSMRQTAGLSQYDLATRMDMKVKEIINYESNPDGIQMSEKAWATFETSLRLVVIDEIRYRRQKRFLKMAR